MGEILVSTDGDSVFAQHPVPSVTAMAHIHRNAWNGGCIRLEATGQLRDHKDTQYGWCIYCTITARACDVIAIGRG